MITLSAPLVLPSPLSETLALATLGSARLDLLNHSVDLVYVYGNTAAGVFTPSAQLPGINVNVNLKTGAIYVNGVVKGWVLQSDLDAFALGVANFTKTTERLAAKSTVQPINTDGSRTLTTIVMALLPGTVA